VSINCGKKVAEAVAAVGEYVQHQPVVGMDESFIQGNSDGNNPQHTKGWLWVLVTPLISYFQVWLSRSQAVAQSLLVMTSRAFSLVTVMVLTTG